MVQQDNAQRKPLPSTRPRYYTAQNAFEHTGFTYTFIRDKAREMGVKIIPFSNGRRLAIDVEDFHAKADQLYERSRGASPTEAETALDPIAEVRRLMNWQVPK